MESNTLNLNISLNLDVVFESYQGFQPLGLLNQGIDLIEVIISDIVSPHLTEAELPAQLPNIKEKFIVTTQPARGL